MKGYYELPEDWLLEDPDSLRPWSRQGGRGRGEEKKKKTAGKSRAKPKKRHVADERSGPASGGLCAPAFFGSTGFWRNASPGWSSPAADRVVRVSGHEQHFYAGTARREFVGEVASAH